MMSKLLIRVWTEMDTEEIKKHLLKAGELSANCENCQHLGIDFTKEAICPNCHTPFKYISFRRKTHQAETFSAIRRLKEKKGKILDTS